MDKNKARIFFTGFVGFVIFGTSMMQKMAQRTKTKRISTNITGPLCRRFEALMKAKSMRATDLSRLAIDIGLKQLEAFYEKKPNV